MAGAIRAAACRLLPLLALLLLLLLLLLLEVAPLAAFAPAVTWFVATAVAEPADCEGSK